MSIATLSVLNIWVGENQTNLFLEGDALNEFSVQNIE